MKKKIKKVILSSLILCLAGILALYGLSAYIQSNSKDFIYTDAASLPDAYTVIVLGAAVRSNGNLSVMLEDRVKSALELYRMGKVKRFLLSGDNGTKFYNEPRAMKEYLMNEGVLEDHIFLDYAGFDTYDSMYRASAVFEVKDAIVVTQEFHIPRTIYIAQKLGLNFYGYVGDKHIYQYENSNKRRELLANVKAFGELLFKNTPTYLGKKIPIQGPPQASYAQE